MSMDRHRSCKGTYSKGVIEAPRTEEEKRAYYKQRKIIPNFSSLFMVRNENDSPEQASKDAFDSPGAKLLEMSEDSLLGPKTKSLRKPLAVNNSVINSSLGVGHHSANNTFDKLVFLGRSRVSQTSQFAACPSSSGSSLDCSELLFKSLLASAPTQDSKQARDIGLKSVPEAKECHVKEADVEQGSVVCLHDGVDPLSKTEFETPAYDEQGQMSTQLFSSDDFSLDSTDYKKETGQAELAEGRTTTKRLQSKKEKISLLPLPSKDTVKEIHSFSSAAEENVKAAAASNTECSNWTPSIKPTQGNVEPSMLGQNYPGIVNVLSPSVQSKLECFSRDHPDQKSPVSQKCLLGTPLKSVGAQHSGKSSVKRDICTSTPANTSRHKTALKSDSPWNLHASPLLENVLSPVPRDTSLITMDTSSVFESPFSFKENNILSSNKVGVAPSHGSEYESCLSSHNFEISHPVSKLLPPLRELLNDISSSEKENQSLERDDICKEVPLCDPKETSGNKLSPPHTFQEDNDADSIPVERRDIEKTPMLVSFTKRRKKRLKRLQSRDISIGEQSVFVIQSDCKISITPDLSIVIPRRTRQQMSKGSQHIPTVIVDSDDELMKGLHENNQPQILPEFEAEESAVDDQSVILIRKPQFIDSRKSRFSVLQKTSAMLKRRTSEKQFRGKDKSTFNSEESNHESSSNTSKLSADDEESPVLTRTRLTNCNRNQLLFTYQLPNLTRRRATMRSLERRTVLSDNMTDEKQELEVPPVHTRRSLRLLTNSSTIPHGGEAVLQCFSAQNKRHANQLSNRNTGHTGDMTSDREKSQALSLHNRRSARLIARNHLTQCNVKNDVREDLSSNDRNMKTALECTGCNATSDRIKSEIYVATTFRKSEKGKADKLMYQKVNSSQDVFSLCSKPIGECSVSDENELESSVPEALKGKGRVKFGIEVLEQKSGDYEELSCAMDDSFPNEEQESLKSQSFASESNMMSKELDLKESTQGSDDENDNAQGKTVKFVQSILNMKTPPELENMDETQPFLSLVPVRRGKGWIRSLSIAVAQTSFCADGSFDAVRRKTIHHSSTRHRSTNLCMSAIQPEISDRVLQMGAHPAEVHSRSTLQISFDQDGQQDYQLPSDPRECVLHLCSQEKYLPLTECFTETRLACCKKIGEGVYGEVFMTRPNPKNMEGATVLKIMPIEGSFPVNGEPQKKFEEIWSEIVISMELSNLQKPDRKENWTENYVHVLNSWCVQGRYHEDLLHLWDVYHEEKGSENDRPDIFPDAQLYIILEFGYGGQDLESYIFNSSRDALAIFLQIAYSLAVAEQELEFEHRDLHWGNVLVAQTQIASITYKLKGRSFNLKTHGLKATVIDFTLSRMKTSHYMVYNNLAKDPSLFTAEGDYQFEIYRQMKKANKNEWEKFTPYTNVLWLHYILDKMTSECYFKNKKTKIHKSHHKQLCKMKNEMFDYESATDFVLRRELV